jgi:hypothetical protein
MATYSAVKQKIIEVLGWFTSDANFKQAYGTTYNAKSKLSDPAVAITSMSLSMMAQGINEQVGPLVADWQPIGDIDLANCDAKTVGDVIKFVCDWGGVAVPNGEPT